MIEISIRLAGLLECRVTVARSLVDALAAGAGLLALLDKLGVTIAVHWP